MITSRKVDKRILRQFSTLDLSMLTLPQAKELIRKIGYRKDTDPELCESFIGKLDGLYYDYDKYVGNPLLLSIMLLTFTETGGILSGKMYRFFEEAYYALSSRHDTVHKKGFRRSFYTGLSSKVLKGVISEFCGSGYNDWNFTFTSEQVAFYLKDMHSYRKLDIPPVDPDAFVEDMKCSLSLIYEASLGRYAFYHRSFQEYFAALYVFGLEDSDLFEASQMFEKGHNSIDDSAFPMFYEMSPERVKKYVFLPLLRELFDECEFSGQGSSTDSSDVGGYADGCLTYLRTRYDVITCQEGIMDDRSHTSTVSLRLNFILGVVGCHEELIDAGMPHIPDFDPEDIYYEVDDGRGGRMIVRKNRLKWKDGYGRESLEYIEDDEEFAEICEGHPKEVGRLYLFDTRCINDKKYKEITDFLISDSSPYRREYDRLLAYYRKLEDECSKPKSRFFRSLSS